MSRHSRLPSITIEDVDGIHLRTAYWPAPEGAVPGVPLLFFNGIGANLELTLGLGDMFPDREILTFDVPGVGLSPVTQWPYRHWMLARWTRKLLDMYGLETVDVMGVSWGGAAARCSSSHGISRSLGVARVMSLKVTQTRAPGRIHWRSGGAPMGCSRARSTAARSSGKPGACVGSMTVVRPSGNSTGNRP